MALTITIEGRGVIANCDLLTNDTGGTGTGDWTEEGGGTMTLTPDVFLYGTNSIAGKYANKDGFQQFDLGAGNELDFGVAGGEEDQFIYMWVNMAAFAVLDDISTGGLFIRVSSDSPGTANYLDYCIAGGNGSSNGVSSNGWTGGWKLFVLDPTLPPTRSNGTQSAIIGSIVTVGLYMEVWDSVRAESIFIDQIAVGSGLRITGDSTTGWQEVMEYCTDYTNRAWGMVQEKDGIYYLFGKFYIGDSTQSANTSFADSGRILQFGTSQYYNSGGSWVSTMPVDACGIIVEDHASYTTTYTDGVIVGSNNGRSGSTILGNADQDISLDLYGGNNVDSVTAFYGTTIKDVLGVINSGNDAGHKFLGCSFLKSSQFDPIGAPLIRNCTFAETIDVDSALLWNESIDIQDCNFIANTLGAAIEMPSDVGTPYSFTRLYFSGNTYDVLNSSGNPIDINKSGIPPSDPSTYEGSTVAYLASVDIIITVKDEGGNLLEDVWVGVYKTSDRTELLKVETISGVASNSYSGSTPVEVEVRCRKSSTADDPRYKNFSSIQTVGTSGLDFAVTMIVDPYNKVQAEET